MYKMAVNFPNLTKGAEVQIDGLGVFENGYEYEVSKEDAEAYRTFHSVIVDELDEDGNLVSRKLAPGRTLLDAFSSEEGVQVATTKASKTKDKPQDPPEGPLATDTTEGGVE